ncbi:PepSY domain-containing protein [Allohahella marinimesophila]|uniref:PepSY domain-containing protein n=1 Tax=Allohahella marinimesophila TaxID=1054972 RepID=A0ABP7NU65_9GAMM
MTRTLMTVALTTAILAPMAQAEIEIDRIEDALKAAEDYGFKHYTEIEFEDSGNIEIEGWVDDSTEAEVDLSAEGKVSNEDRKNSDGGPTGATIEDIRQAIDTAKAQGMTKVEDITSEKAGEVEIEGEKSDGEDLELNLVTAQRK